MKTATSRRRRALKVRIAAALLRMGKDQRKAQAYAYAFWKDGYECGHTLNGAYRYDADPASA